MEYWGGKNYFVFVGDSRTEQLYHSFIQQISSTYHKNSVPETFHGLSGDVGDKWNAKVPSVSSVPKHVGSQNRFYNDSHLGLRVQFLFCPYPNKSMISALQQWKVTVKGCDLTLNTSDDLLVPEVSNFTLL